MNARFVAAVSLGMAACTLASADSIKIKDREKPLVGVVKSENAQSVVVIVGKKMESIPSADVLDIHYDDIRPLDLVLAGGPLRLARETERSATETKDAKSRVKLLAKALVLYQDAQKKMKPHVFATRHMEFKVASLALKLAEEQQAPTDLALQQLREFKTKHADSWQNHQVHRLIEQVHKGKKQ